MSASRCETMNTKHQISGTIVIGAILLFAPVATAGSSTPFSVGGGSGSNPEPSQCSNYGNQVTVGDYKCEAHYQYCDQGTGAGAGAGAGGAGGAKAGAQASAGSSCNQNTTR